MKERLLSTFGAEYGFGEYGDKRKKNDLNRKNFSSFTYNPEFRQTKRFLRYKQEIISMMNEFLKSEVSTLRIKEEYEKGAYVEDVKMIPNWREYYKSGIVTQFSALTDITLGVQLSTVQLIAACDRPSQFHVEGFSIMWDCEAEYVKNRDGDYDALPENICYEYMTGESSGKIPSKKRKKFDYIPSIDEVMDKEFEELCLEYIREREIQESNFNDATWYKLCKLTTKNDLFNFMVRYARNLNSSVWQIVKYQTDYYRSLREESKAGSLKKQLSKLQAECDMNLEKEKQHSVYLENQLIAAKEKIAELERKIHMVKEECNKQHKAEIYSTQKAKEKVDKSNQELEEKYKALKERNKFLEELLEEAESKSVSSDEKGYENDEGFFQKRYVFVRNKAQEGYLIFQELAKKFPNAIFTNGIANDIDPKNTDGVVLLTRYEKHGIYWGMRNACKEAGVLYAHCDTSNLDRICSIMYNVFIKQGERKDSYKL